MTSSIDLAPTILSLAGIEIPEHLQGQAFLGSQASKTPRKYVFAGRDRMDEIYDRVRSVRDKQFRYLCNYMTDRPKYMDLKYRRTMGYMQEILDLHNQGKLDKYQEEWFVPTKPQEELYDVLNDPDELHNLADDPAYTNKLEELRAAFQTWTKEVGDLGALDEKDMLLKWWNGKETPPTTATPILTKVKDGYRLTCETEGASIGYKILNEGEELKKQIVPQYSFDMMWTYGVPNGNDTKIDTPWSIYKDGDILHLQPGQQLLVNAKRIGYITAEKNFTIE